MDNELLNLVKSTLISVVILLLVMMKEELLKIKEEKIEGAEAEAVAPVVQKKPVGRRIKSTASRKPAANVVIREARSDEPQESLKRKRSRKIILSHNEDEDEDDQLIGSILKKQRQPEISLGAPYPKLPKTIFPYTNPSTVFTGKAESWATTKRNWKILFHAHEPEPEPSSLYPLPEYQFEPEPIQYPLYLPIPYEGTGPLPSELTNSDGPLLTHLPLKVFPPKKIYPNLIKMELFKPIIDGVDRDVIPIWSSVPGKKDHQKQEYRRSRTFNYRRFILDRCTKWKKFVHPSNYGALADIGDYIMYGHLLTEFSIPRHIRAASFVPPTWLHHKTGVTNVGMVPYRICPRLPMIDLNKNKDEKFRLPNITLPLRAKVMLDVSIDATIDDDIMKLYSSVEGENFDDEARGFWESHIKICSRQASSSGLSAEEKAETPIFKGVYGFSEARYFIHNDTISIPLRSPIIYEDDVHWIVPEPEETLSEQMEEIVVEQPEAEMDDTSTRSGQQSSQPDPLAVVHPQISQALSILPIQSSVDATAESSRTTLPPELDEIISRKIEVQVERSVQQVIQPTNALLQQMFQLLSAMGFQQQPPPEPPTQPPPPPPSNS